MKLRNTYLLHNCILYRYIILYHMLHIVSRTNKISYIIQVHVAIQIFYGKC